jgi:hypothetical protein
MVRGRRQGQLRHHIGKITTAAVFCVRYTLRANKQLSTDAVIKTCAVSQPRLIVKVITLNAFSVRYVLRPKKQLRIEDVTNN